MGGSDGVVTSCLCRGGLVIAIPETEDGETRHGHTTTGTLLSMYVRGYFAARGVTTRVRLRFDDD